MFSASIKARTTYKLNNNIQGVLKRAKFYTLIIGRKFFYWFDSCEYDTKNFFALIHSTIMPKYLLYLYTLGFNLIPMAFAKSLYKLIYVFRITKS